MVEDAGAVGKSLLPSAFAIISAGTGGGFDDEDQCTKRNTGHSS